MNKILAQVDTKIVTPDFLDLNNLTIGGILGWGIRMVFVVSALFVLYNLLFGAVEWIQSGGDKEKVDKARKRITTAITGLVILFVVIGAVLLIEAVFGIGLGFSKSIFLPRFCRAH